MLKGFILKITLINPPFLFAYLNEVVFSQCLGLRSLSSFLKMKGCHEVSFIDALMLGFSNVKRYYNGYIVGLETDEIVANISADTDLIGISAPFSQLAPVVHNIIDRVKMRFPNIPVVMGGIYPSTQPDLALTSKADFIIVGEGESAMSDMADGRDPNKIEGVYSKDSVSSKYFPAASMISDLDKLPFADYSIPLIDRYFTLSPRGARARRTASLVTSRGCPYDCEFCSIHPVYGQEYRYRSAKGVLEEIEYLVERHSAQSLEIEDDNFTLHKERTIEILEGIVRLNEKGAGLEWRTPNGIRIDACDEEMIKLIKKSNCTEIVLALEHGDPGMLLSMNKKLDLDKAFNVIKQFVQYRIPAISLFVIVGYPGETRKHFLNGVSYLKKVMKLGKNIHLCVNIAQPYPGTKLLTRCRKEGYITDKNFENFLIRKDLINPAYTVSIITPDFDRKEVLLRKEFLQSRLDNRSNWKSLVKRLLPLRLIIISRFLIHKFTRL